MPVQLGTGLPFGVDGYAVNAFEAFSDGAVTNLNQHMLLRGGLSWEDSVTFTRTGPYGPILQVT